MEKTINPFNIIDGTVTQFTLYIGECRVYPHNSHSTLEKVGFIHKCPRVAALIFFDHWQRGGLALSFDLFIIFQIVKEDERILFAIIVCSHTSKHIDFTNTFVVSKQ